MDQADGEVGDHLGGAGFDVGPIVLVGHLGAGAEAADEEGLGGVFGPEAEIAGAEVVAVVLEELARLARATFISLSSFSLEVPEASLPSTMFCFPERAVCTIWSTVRSPRLRKRWQKR